MKKCRPTACTFMESISLLLSDGHVAVVVAMAVVRVMQMALYEVIHVIAVRDCLVTAVGTMRVRRVMTVAGMTIGAVRRIRRTDLEGVLVDVALVGMVHVSVVKEVGVAVVLNGSMAAVLAMLMGVILVDAVFGIHHGSFQ